MIMIMIMIITMIMIIIIDTNKTNKYRTKVLEMEITDLF